MVLEAAALSHLGRVRSHNEDCIAVEPGLGFAVLADGMGGHNAGEVASRMAVELIAADLKARPEARLDVAAAEALVGEELTAANNAVYEAARADRRYEGMGTTVVVAVWHAGGVTYGHIGDSRLYRLRDGALTQLTRDHTIVQAQLERGAISREQARYAANRNVLTRAVGIDPDVAPEIRTSHVRAGDVYLLSSDGLTDMLQDDEIRDVVADCGDMAAAAERLVARANENGGLDNISVILVRVVTDAGDERA